MTIKIVVTITCDQCNKTVEIDIKDIELLEEWEGDDFDKTFHFCSEQCKHEFYDEPF